jgi:hypothetical protein
MAEHNNKKCHSQTNSTKFNTEQSVIQPNVSRPNGIRPKEVEPICPLASLEEVKMLRSCWKLVDNKNKTMTQPVWSCGAGTFGRKTFGRKTFGRKTFGRKTFSRRTFGRQIPRSVERRQVSFTLCRRNVRWPLFGDLSGQYYKTFLGVIYAISDVFPYDFDWGYVDSNVITLEKVL